MGALFAKYDPNQQLLLPPCLRDWLPDGHLVYFISDTVDQLDISAITSKYRKKGSGNLPYHPRLMLKLLMYGYSTGTFSSRKIAKQIEENVAFRVLAADQSPGHRSLCRFRKDHIDEFGDLFVQVVQIAVASGLVSMGTLAIDGSKIKANASKHKAMSYDRMKTEEKRLQQEIKALIKAATDKDALEDVEFGPNFRGDELPAELARRESRLKTIKAAKAGLEERKKAEAAAAEKEKRKGKGKAGAPKAKDGKPKDKDQENFTDPDSRIMKAGAKGFQQSYNAQIGVDTDKCIIVAAEVSQSSADSRELIPVIDAATENTELTPEHALADAGYRSEENFGEVEAREIKAFIPLGREGKKDKPVGDDKPATQRMQRRMRTKRGRRRYAARKHTVEPPFGWIKWCLGFRSFSLRGHKNVGGEWNLVCMAMNLKRMNQWIAWT